MKSRRLSNNMKYMGILFLTISLLITQSTNAQELDITKFNIDENQEFTFIVDYRLSTNEYGFGIDDISGDRILIANGSNYTAIVENNAILQVDNKYFVDTVILTNGVLNATISPEITIKSLFTFRDWEYWENNLTARYETSISEGFPVSYEILNLPDEFIHVYIHNGSIDGSSDLYYYEEFRYDKTLGLRTLEYIILTTGTVDSFTMERYESYQYFPLDVVKVGPPYPTDTSNSGDTSKSDSASLPGLLLFNSIVTVILLRKVIRNSSKI